jgi:hypothetical protein
MEMDHIAVQEAPKIRSVTPAIAIADGVCIFVPLKI